MLTYDELEEQYFILKERVRILEAENNSLALRNLELETEAVDIERQLSKIDKQNDCLVKDYQEKVLEAISMKVILEEKDKRIREAEQERESMIIHADNPKQIQAASNLKIPRHSINLPMEQVPYDARRSSIILHEVDRFHFYKDTSAATMEPQYHVMAKSDHAIFRYASQSLLFLDRTEDFAVVVDQILDGLKYQIVEHYFKNKYP